MSMDDGPWQPGEGATDPDVEWAFFGAHDIEYWVVRDDRLVPASASELERIAEWERERTAHAYLLRWERQQRHAHLSDAIARMAGWCRGLVRRRFHRPVRTRAGETSAAIGQRDVAAGRRSDVASR